MYKFQLFLCAIFVPSAVFSLQCLVIRPGFGLVTESCPAGSVGCRIRISKDAVDFYEYSALYDRNQFVCLHRAEFDEAKHSGCMRKKNGRVRCWCHGRSNCNTAEASKALYEAFVSDDKDYFDKVVREIDSGPEVTDFSPALTTTTTPSPEVVKVPIVSRNEGGMVRGGGGNNRKTSSSGGIIMGGDNGRQSFVRQPGSRKLEGPQKPSDSVKDNEGESIFSKSSTGTDHKLRHHHYRTEGEKDQSKRLATSRGSFSNKGPEEVQRKSMLVNNNDDITPTLHPTVKPKPSDSPGLKTKVLLDKNSEIHVITVGAAQDQYDLQNTDSAAATEPRTLPTEVTSDDLYDEEELAKMDAELMEQQKRQNRPNPIPESPLQPIRVLPQEDDIVSDEVPESLGEYFDSASNAISSSLSFSLMILIFIRVL